MYIDVGFILECLRVCVIFTRNFDNSRIIFIPLFEIYVKCFGGVKVPMCN